MAKFLPMNKKQTLTIGLCSVTEAIIVVVLLVTVLGGTQSPPPQVGAAATTTTMTPVQQGAVTQSQYYQDGYNAAANPTVEYDAQANQLWEGNVYMDCGMVGLPVPAGSDLRAVT